MSLPHDAVGWSAVCDCDFKTKEKPLGFQHQVCLYMISLLSLKHCTISKSKKKLTELLEQLLIERALFIKFEMRKTFSLFLNNKKNNNLWSCQSLSINFENLSIRLGFKLCRQIVCTPMSTTYSSWVQFCFVMRETSCCLFLAITRLVSLRRSTLLQEI